MIEREEAQELINRERDRQDAKWGPQNHLAPVWMLIAQEEMGEIAKSLLEKDSDGYMTELVQATAVMVAWVESELRRRKAERG